MTVEAYVGTSIAVGYTTIHLQLFDLAVFFSQSSLFDIIDSYSANSTPTRFKGDPIDNGSWTTSADVNLSNSWFVISAITAPIILQNENTVWQCKFQGTGNTGFADPSGIDYGSVGTTRVLRHRFAPYGGWNLADVTPDFVGPNAQSSGKNRNTYNTNGGSGGDAKTIIVADDGQLAIFVLSVNTNKISHFKSYMGDIIPVDSINQLMHRMHIYTSFNLVEPDSVGNNSGLPEGSFLNTSPDCSIEYENEVQTWVTSDPSWRLPTDSYDIDAYTQPNSYDTNPGLDIAPYKPLIETIGFLGEIPLLGKTYGKGNGAKFNSGNWLSYGETYCMVSKWEPAISVR